MSQFQDSAEMMANELQDMTERVEELIDFAEDMDYTAVQHKLQEARGKLDNAVAAAFQYSTGELT